MAIDNMGALFYPTKDQNGKEISFDSLFIPYIYKEIYFDGVYLDVFNGRENLTVVDIGANIGVVTQYMRQYAKKLYAVEPSPEHFEALKQNKEFNHWDNVEVFNYALADKDGELELTQNSFNRTMNTLIIGKKEKEGRFELNTGIPDLNGTINTTGYKDRVMVKTKGFDTFMEENNIDKVDFCKFDVEGAEDMILRSDGFRKVAPRISAIEVEMHFPVWQNLVQYMMELGFAPRRYECDAIVILFTH